METPNTAPALRKQIKALATVRASLARLNASQAAIDAVQIAICELEDAYIAEVNYQKDNR